MKKSILLVLLLCIVIPLVGCGKEEDLRTDAVKFKEEYESLNKTESKDGSLYRTISVDEENPIVYTTYEKLSSLIDEKKNFLVYFGSKTSKYSRSVVPYLIKQAKTQGIDVIYYVELASSEEESGVKEVGVEDMYYQQMMKKLNESSVTDSTLAVFVNGNLAGKSSVVSSKQTDGDMELTKDMKDEMTANCKKIYITYNSNRG